MYFMLHVLYKTLHFTCSLGCGIGYGYLHRIPTRASKSEIAKSPYAQLPQKNHQNDGYSPVSISNYLFVAFY